LNALARKSLRHAGGAIGCALAAIAFVWFCGLMIPSRHEAAASLRVEAAPEAVLAVLASVEGYPRWRSDVAKAEAMAGGDSGKTRWRETDSEGRVTAHEAEEASRPGSEKWVDRFTSADGRIRVERIFLIVAEGEIGTRVALTGKTELEDPLARFRARFVSGYAEDLDALLDDLRKRLGE
jgi:hypothetical protein